MKLYTFLDKDGMLILEVRADNHDQAIANANDSRINYHTDFYSEYLPTRYLNIWINSKEHRVRATGGIQNYYLDYDPREPLQIPLSLNAWHLEESIEFKNFDEKLLFELKIRYLKRFKENPVAEAGCINVVIFDEQGTILSKQDGDLMYLPMNDDGFHTIPVDYADDEWCISDIFDLGDEDEELYRDCLEVTKSMPDQVFSPFIS